MSWLLSFGGLTDIPRMPGCEARIARFERLGQRQNGRDVWVMNNWQDIDSCYKNASEALSTRCGGQGVVIFFGMAKPVRAPQIAPARGYD